MPPHSPDPMLGGPGADPVEKRGPANDVKRRRSRKPKALDLNMPNREALDSRRNRKMPLWVRKSASYPALAGRQLYCGLRQSIPSSKHAS